MSDAPTGSARPGVPPLVAGLCVLVCVTWLATGCAVERRYPQAPKSSRLLDPYGARPVAGGLVVDPADGSLVAATNRGLFRSLAAEDPSWTRTDAVLETPRGRLPLRPPFVADAVGPGRLVGTARVSTGKGSDQPGLMESRDAGRTWRRLPDTPSMRGVIAVGAAGSWVYALARGRNAMGVHVSNDGGRTFDNRIGPAGTPVDVAIDPAFPSVVVAATTHGLWLSGNAGRDWRELVREAPRTTTQPQRLFRGPRLAWTAETGLIVVDPDGRISVSRDQGVTFVSIGRFRGDPEAVGIDGEGDLLILLADGTVVRHDLPLRRG